MDLTEEKALSICVAEKKYNIGHTEIDLYADHGGKRHRTVMDDKTSIFWEQ